MKILKKILLKVLGLKLYLKVISKLYIRMVSLGFGKKNFPEIFYLNNIIKEGFYCIDIGANVGYFSFFISKKIGASGRITAVEPISLFADIWESNMKKSPFKNYKILRFALGDSEKNVKMGTPLFNGVLHHGMTKVIENNEQSYHITSEVAMKVPDELFKNIKKLDFLKVDIEGYENIVFSNFLQTINKFRPIIQTELSGKENRERVVEMLSSIAYKPYILNGHKLFSATEKDLKEYENDFYFLPEPIQ